MESNELMQSVFSGGNFSSLDWFIVAGYMSLLVVVGLVANRFISGIASYVVAGRGLGTALSVATMTGTEL